MGIGIGPRECPNTKAANKSWPTATMDTKVPAARERKLRSTSSILAVASSA
ncbi:MAG: hypothetical protein HC923_11795 [Myxococcales bacterium]|nr:hypothetical protein [Myxococcales bacterium]